MPRIGEDGGPPFGMDPQFVLEKARGTSMREVQDSGMYNKGKGISAATGLATAQGAETGQTAEQPRLHTITTDFSIDVHTGDTNSTVIRTITVPANTLGATGGLRFQIFGTGLCSNAGAIVGVDWGGTTYFSMSLPNQTTVTFYGEAQIFNWNDTAVQKGPYLYDFQSSGGARASWNGGVQDTTADVDIDVYVLLGHADDQVQLHGHMLTIF